MEKFSYFLFALLAANSIRQGTGSFIQKNGKTYLATASHIFHKDKYATEKIAPSFSVRLVSDDGQSTVMVNVINNPLPRNNYHDLDLAIYPVNLPKGYQVNYIDYSLPGDDESFTPSVVLSFGFPVDEVENNLQKYISMPKMSKFVGRIFMNYHKAAITVNDITGKVEVDKDNYYFKYVSEGLGHGQSGSPVFIRSTDSDKYYFGGILIERDEIIKQGTALRPERVIAAIEQIN